MDRTRVARGALKYLLLMATLTTGMLGVFVFGERPSAEVHEAKRRPSQIDEDSRPRAVLVDCWDKVGPVDPVPRGTRYVLVQGKLCNGAVPLEAITVTNTTNKMTGTVFPLGDGMTTDMVRLSEGANDLVITVIHDGTPTEGHVLLTR